MADSLHPWSALEAWVQICSPDGFPGAWWLRQVYANGAPPFSLISFLKMASSKIDKALARLKNLDRTQTRESDFSMFPKHFVPVMTFEDGGVVVRPMRYQCRPDLPPFAIRIIAREPWGSRVTPLQRLKLKAWCPGKLWFNSSRRPHLKEKPGIHGLSSSQG
jgi:hypothetical protein